MSVSYNDNREYEETKALHKAWNQLRESLTKESLHLCCRDEEEPKEDAI